MHSYVKMADTGIGKSFRGRRLPLRIIFSYLFDWIVCLAFAGIGGVFDRLSPAKRPFSLVDPSISYPFEEHELVPAYLLFTLAIGVPIVIVAIVSLIFVPGPTVPKGTPAALIWQRKLWELHVGLLGLVLSLTLSWFFTSTMKNLFGKPRPDLLARCKPDVKNIEDHIVGGFSWGSMTGQLVSASICTETDDYKLNDGFRSYPSGHASTAAGGLIYASLFLASKFSVVVPFVMPSAASAAGASGAASHAAFPSRLVRPEIDPFEPTRGRGFDDGSASMSPTKGSPFADNAGQHNAKVQSLRRQAAAPPVYLLVLGLFALWRLHFSSLVRVGTIAVTTASISSGAGWAWGPRSDERAFWAGVGRLGYAGTDEELALPSRRPTQGVSADSSYPMTSALAQRNVRPRDESADEPRPSQNFQDVELQQMDDRGRPENRFPEPLDNRV
ncbi:hypothetical protein CEP52_000398 [Fusarium oligoseptatum]|uniref:Phosphatidic acid phosphatase type 2/haloperoxidase domain-containing protein n=1 Tax=Fusarium oligoseptatum TaxID=2604345 RepID=A0A428UPV6_9HYPO|nr:hypothetical protein CEP52_000398 [Fusarium oligoseptatum]